MDTLPDPLPAIRVAEEEIQVIGHRHALVRSHTNPDHHHIVEQDPDGEWHCSCEGWNFRHRCRHLVAVREWALGRIPATLIENASPEHRDQFSAIR